MRLIALSSVFVLVVFGDVSWGANITASEGTFFDGISMQPYDSLLDESRKILANTTDGDTATIYALGVAGSVTIDVNPRIFDGEVDIVEFTYANIRNDYPESAKVVITGDSRVLFKGELVNDGVGGSTYTLQGSEITITESGNFSRFSIPVLEDTFKVELFDTTWLNFAAMYLSANRATDGFDVSELIFESVPEPSTSILVTMPLLLAFRRRY